MYIDSFNPSEKPVNVVLTSSYFKVIYVHSFIYVLYLPFIHLFNKNLLSTFFIYQTYVWY